MSDVEIFVCQIVPAGKADPAVNHRDFPVIPVIQEHIEARKERIEYTAFYAKRPHFLYKAGIDKADGAHVVIEDPDLHSCLYAFHQHLFYSVPAFRILDGMVFHKYKFFRFPHICNLGVKSLICVIIKGHIRIPVQRIMGVIYNIGSNPSCFRVLLLQLL